MLVIVISDAELDFEASAAARREPRPTESLAMQDPLRGADECAEWDDHLIAPTITNNACHGMKAILESDLFALGVAATSISDRAFV